ncbi:hypothetical protein Zmor_013717 [Zophobas morio]|uniref:Gustatory receptor n=1 Tax=Zophobas morio TaxID=2755281 RepID=A0AA38II94_9CUCU|nr:hypothetical protein Zmor_013717 [Zophobas morio]
MVKRVDSFVKLFSLAKEQKISTKPFVTKNCDVDKMNQKLTTHSSLSFLLIFAQCFGMLPVSGITNEDSSSLKFYWTSKRSVYSMTFAAASTLNVIFFIIKMTNTKSAQFSDYVTLLFFMVTLITIMIFIDIARKWPSLIKKWTVVDIAMSSYDFPVNLHTKMKIIAGLIMGAAVVEHSLFVSTVFISCGVGYNIGETVDRFLKYRFGFVFEVTGYDIVWGLFLQMLNIFSTISWNFMDLFIILISLCLSERFKQVTKRIRFLASKNVIDLSVWEKVREDYTRLTVLCESVDNLMSNVILVSFGNNIFVILVQLFNTLTSPPHHGILDKTYYVYSFGFLIIRLIAVAMCAATVNSESKKPKHYLNTLSTLIYNVEVDRLLHYVKYNTAALTGHKIFRVTRTLILRISLAIVSYELVLVQMLNHG